MNGDERNDVIEIDLFEIFALLLRRWWIILLCGILGAGGGFMYSRFGITPQYVSYTSVYILNKSDNNVLTFSDTQLANQITKDYETIITSRFVLEQVIEQYGLDESYEEFRERVLVSKQDDTRVLSIGVKDTNPKMAKKLADGLRAISSDHIQSVMDLDAVKLVDEANLAKEPSEPSKKKWTLACGAIGIMLCCGYFIVRYLMDDTIKTTEDVERYLGISTLTMVPFVEKPVDRKGILRRREEIMGAGKQKSGKAKDSESDDSGITDATSDLVEMRMKQVMSEVTPDSKKGGEQENAVGGTEEGDAGLQN